MCINWQIEGGNYSKDLADSANGYVTKNFKPTLKMQELKSKGTQKNLACGNLNRSMAK